VDSKPSFRQRCDGLLHHPRFEIALVLLILLSVVLIVLEFGPANERGPLSHLHLPVRIAGDFLTLLFVVELSLRYWVASRKGRFFRRYWLDILSVVPFLRFFRILRILRLLRAGVLINRRLESISTTLAAGLGLQLSVFLVLGMIVLCGGLAIFMAEGGSGTGLDSLGESFWWSFFTLAAGEPIGATPETDAGRVVAMLVVLGGITMFAVFTGVVSAFMVQRLKIGMEDRDMDLDELSGHIVICGWNRSGQYVVEGLLADPVCRRHAIVVLAEFETTPETTIKAELRSYVYFQKGDYTRIETLEAVGIRRATRAILLADKTRSRSDQDRDARTVLAALTIEKLNPEIDTCAQLLDRGNNVQLQVAGVEDVLVDDEICGRLIASSVQSEGMIPLVTEMLSLDTGSHLTKVAMPVDWEGKNFNWAAQQLKDQHDALLIGVEREEEGHRRTLLNPDSEMPLLPGDKLLFLATKRPDLG